MITVDHLTKSFDGAGGMTLRGVSFRVEDSQIYTLLGPSGCGKTTSMRCIAGLESPDSGHIQLGKTTVFSSKDRIDVPTDQRNLGMVFQSYAIWPHMTVAENAAYPIEGRGAKKAEIARRVASVLDLVGLSGLGDRPAPLLSGGQQQRVALARAIIGNPMLLLLDEPLSNLDAALRAQMRTELIRLQRSLGQTILYVTHDQDEALSMSHRIALMQFGRIVEEGPPTTLYHHPRHPFTAAFLGAANFIPCEVRGAVRDGDAVQVETAFGRFSATARMTESHNARLFFRPRAASICISGAGSQLNRGKATVTDALFLGETIELLLAQDDIVIRVRTTSPCPVAPGDEVSFDVDERFNVVFLPGD